MGISNLIDQEVEAGIRVNIRRFSHEVAAQEPDNRLAQCLEKVTEEKEHHLSGPWSFAYRDEDATPLSVHRGVDVLLAQRDLEPGNIDTESQLLNEQLNKFLESADIEHEEKIRKKKGRWNRGGNNDDKTWRVEAKDGRPPRIEDVTATVLEAERKWRDKDRLGNGKAQGCFHALCRILSDHANMFDMLPHQSQYSSIICGGIKILIKASINHQKIAEELATALATIMKELGKCVKQFKLTNTKDMRQAIGELYSHFFEFVRSAIKWFESKSWKKALNALNENFYDAFEDRVSKITALSSAILEDGRWMSQAELRDVHITVAQLKKNADESDLYQKQMLSMLQQVILGMGTEKTLQSHIEAWTYADEVSPQGPSLSVDDIGSRRSSPRKRASPSSSRSYKRSELQGWSRDLEDYTTDVSILLGTIPRKPTYSDPSIVEHLQVWSGALRSQVLWVKGVFEDTYPSSTSTIAANVVRAAVAIRLPVVCFFCNFPDGDFEGDDDFGNKIETAVIDCAYSLIRQIISILPSHVETRAKLSQSSFTILDGTLDTWDAVVKILKALIALLPSTCLIVIDGIQQLDDTGAEDQVDEILDLLQEAVAETTQRTANRQECNKFIKILYTTAGDCGSLDKFDEDSMEVVIASERKARRALGQPRPGRQEVVLDFTDESSDDEQVE